jgi:hypothetical protein
MPVEGFGTIELNGSANPSSCEDLLLNRHVSMLPYGLQTKSSRLTTLMLYTRIALGDTEEAGR